MTALLFFGLPALLAIIGLCIRFGGSSTPSQRAQRDARALLRRANRMQS